jgi:NAD(P)-dependent dehydrogenase (short-subunit alcohol dehydrogenase family)
LFLGFSNMARVAFDIGLGLEDCHVLITGSSGAIGSTLVEAFLAAGAYVTAWDIVKPREGVDNAKLLCQQVDVTDEVAVEEALGLARSKRGPITTCVLAAGVDLSYCQHRSLIDMPLEEWRRILRINVDGTFLTCRAWLRELKAHATPQSRNCSAIVFGSEAGIFGVADCAPYAASKSAIQYGFVKSLARDAVDVHPRCRM